LDRISVTCAIIEKEDKILCAQRSAAMPLPLKWEFPGGKVEPDESEKSFLVREILEELNLVIDNLKKLPSNLYAFKDGKTIELIPFRRKVTAGIMLLKEHQQIKWVTKKDLLFLDWEEADIPIVEYYKKHF
jgi:8-oxo-dGTP diphosphatase